MIHEQLYLRFFVESFMSDLPTIGPNVWASRPVPAATRRSIFDFHLYYHADSFIMPTDNRIRLRHLYHYPSTAARNSLVDIHVLLSLAAWFLVPCLRFCQRRIDCYYMVKEFVRMMKIRELMDNMCTTDNWFVPLPHNKF